MRFKKLKAEIEELEDKLTTNEDLQETIQNDNCFSLLSPI